MVKKNKSINGINIGIIIVLLLTIGMLFISSDETNNGEGINTIIDSSENGGWDISKAMYLHGFSVSSQNSKMNDIFFKPDGSKMYIVGTAARMLDYSGVYEYDLSTRWDATSATYLKRIVVADDSPQGIFFKPDGSKMYTVGSRNGVHEYDLSTRWDATSATYLQKVDIPNPNRNPTGIFFKPDGSKMYIIESLNHFIEEYDLSTPWNVTSATYLQDIKTRDGYSTGIFFKPDGSKMYTVGLSGDMVSEYDLSILWDIKSAIYLQEIYIGETENNPRGIFFKPDGSKMYTIGYGNMVSEYNIS